MQTVTFRGTRAQFQRLLNQLPALLAGHHPDPTGLVEGLLLRVGTAVLSRIKEAFVIKARGGTDDSGIKWAPLLPKTIAYGRRHPGLNRKRKAAAKRGNPGRPLLSKAQDTRWRQIYARQRARFERAGEANASAHAAAYAWTILKAEGGKTILGTYGTTSVEILRDTGRLLNSLSPGLPGKPANADQVLRTEPGAVIVGTNVVYAGTHHRGNPAKKIPARPFWPKVLPAAWQQDVVDVIRSGMSQLLAHLVARGPL